MADEPKKDITYFAETDFRNKKVPFGIKPLDRLRHFYVVGKTGMGKSTLLERMTIQDINNGNGIGYIDPHGSSAELFLDYIPEDRIKDVIYFAPHDLEFPIAFNVMEDVGKDQRHLVANGLMAAFKKIWPDVWSARMEYISTNIILALLEYPDSTLLGVNRMLSDKVYRKKVVDNVTDPVVKSFWVDEFAKYSEKLMVEAGASIQNKFGQFVSNPLIRNIVGQPKSTFNIRDVMDGKKILIMNLSKGRMGELNANLIGGMLITKIYLAAMSRASESADSIKKLAPFYFVVDEFQSFVNESFRDILSEARKYQLSLTLAHQYIEQVPEEVRDAVFGNVGTTVSFRVGPFDAEVLEKVFGPKFIAEDLVNLGFAQIYLTLMIDGVGSAPFSAKTLGPIPKPAISYKEQVMEHSRKTYGRTRADVEEEIKKWHEVAPPEVKVNIPISPTTVALKTPYKTPAPVAQKILTPTTPINTYKTPPTAPIFVANKPTNSLPAVSRVELPAVNKIELPVVSKPSLPAVSSVVSRVEPPQKMSLSSLANNAPSNSMKPKSTGANIGDLRSAIAEAMKSAKSITPTLAKITEAPHKPPVVTGATEVKPVEKVEVKMPEVVKTEVKEVPEKVLRQILNTETNDKQ
ncbi:MAG: type IV secretion system DNA-binding domain-containing protein [bacterium]|nr:type IV secretion system DNA-binding domain-containing protein [bacterium]